MILINLFESTISECEYIFDESMLIVPLVPKLEKRWTGRVVVSIENTIDIFQGWFNHNLLYLIMNNIQNHHIPYHS